jgi:hypothetical protein
MTMREPKADGFSGDANSTLAERAAAAARAELRGERAGILGVVGQAALPPLARRKTVPNRWSFLYVPPPQMAV